MPSIDVCYTKDNVFEISTSSLFATDDIGTTFLEEWNIPKYVSKLSDVKDYKSIEEIPLTNRFSCLGDALQKEIERTGSPPLVRGREKYLTINRESKKGTKLSRHKSMSDIDVQNLNMQACDNKHKPLFDLNGKLIEKKRNNINSRKSNIARHKSMSDLNTKSIKQKKSTEKSRKCQLSRNKSMSELHYNDKKDYGFLLDGLDDFEKETKKSMESLIDHSELKSSGFQKSQKKQRRSRKHRKLNSVLIKSKSTSDLSELKDEDTLFNDKAYTDFSAMLKSVKHTLQEIIDVSNKENITKDQGNIKEEVQKKRMQSRLPVKSNLQTNAITSQLDSYGEKKLSALPLSAKKSRPLTDSKATNVQVIPQKIKPNQDRVNKEEITKKERSIPTPLRIAKKEDYNPKKSYQPGRLQTQKSVTTQTSTNDKHLVSEQTQTVQSEDFVDRKTQTTISMTSQKTTETQTDDLFPTMISSKGLDQSSLNGDENSSGEEESISDGNDEGISEGDSDTNDEATCDKAPTVSVTPSRWLANMGMHKLCIFSSKETARIKSYDYFLPQVHDFDPNLVVVHIGISEYPIFKDGKDEETPSVGEAIMKVVEICSDYGVKDVVLCNIKNRSTGIIRERRAKLAECLVPRCKKEGVKFKYNNKLYKQNVPQTAVKLTVPGLSKLN